MQCKGLFTEFILWVFCVLLQCFFRDKVSKNYKIQNDAIFVIYIFVRFLFIDVIINGFYSFLMLLFFKVIVSMDLIILGC
jgi:hypothetical protein